MQIDGIKEVDKDPVSKQLKDLGFTGKRGTFQGLNLDGQYVVFYGAGKQDDLKSYNVRELGAQLYAALLKYKSTDISVCPPAGKPLSNQLNLPVNLLLACSCAVTLSVNTKQN